MVKGLVEKVIFKKRPEEGKKGRREIKKICKKNCLQNSNVNQMYALKKGLYLI